MAKTCAYRHCSNQFIPKRVDQRFCSPKCGMRENNRNHRAAGALDTIGAARVCQACSRVFIPRTGRQWFCSGKCHQRHRYPETERSCRNCGNPFVSATSGKNSKLSCSSRCTKAFNQRKFLALNPGYPDRYKDKVRESMSRFRCRHRWELKRDGIHDEELVTMLAYRTKAKRLIRVSRPDAD
jgi:hypothetical protein